MSRLSRALDHPLAPPLAAFVVAVLVRGEFLWRLSRTAWWNALSSDGTVYWNWATVLIEQNFQGTQPFFMGPLYPYALALARSFGAATPGAIVVLQSLGGALAAAMLAAVFARVLPVRAALVAGVLMAASEHFAWYDAMVLMESPLWLMSTMLLWLLVPRPPAWPGERARWWAALLVGLMAQARASNAVLFAPLALLGETPTTSWRDRVRRAAPVLAIAALTAAPSLWHHHVNVREWIPYTYNGGYNAFVGNHAYATGSFVTPFADSGTAGLNESIDGSPPRHEGGINSDGRDRILQFTGQRLSPEGSSRWWGARAREWMQAHPREAAALLAKKLAMLFSRTEYWQLESPLAFRLLAGRWGLPWPPMIVLILALAPVGAFAAWRTGGWARLPVLHVLMLAAATAAFFVTDRYRLHLLAPLAVLAAMGARHLAACVRARTPQAVLPALVLAAAGLAMAFAPLPRRSPELERWTALLDAGAHTLEHGDAARAAELLGEAVQLERLGPRPGPRDATARGTTATLHAIYGMALVQSDREDEALPWLRRAGEAAPGSHLIMVALARAEALAGAHEIARVRLARAGVRADTVGERLFEMAFEENRRGRGDRTEKLLRASHGLAPSFAPATGVLVRWLCNSVRAAEADSVLDAAPLEPRVAFAWRAHVRWARGDATGAREAWHSAMALPPSQDGGAESALQELGAALPR